MVCTGFCHFICGHPSIEAIELQIDIEVGFIHLRLLDGIGVLNSQEIQTKHNIGILKIVPLERSMNH